MTQDKEAFLDRWSRLKREQPEPEAQPPATAEAKDAEAVPVPLQPVEELQPDSDFTPFMAGNVKPETRRAALKKLFTDAHFNEHDLFEPYSIDLTVSETIPDEMLKSMNHAKRLIFDEEKPAAEAEATVEEQAQASPQPQVQIPEPDDGIGRKDT